MWQKSSRTYLRSSKPGTLSKGIRFLLKGLGPWPSVLQAAVEKEIPIPGGGGGNDVQ